MNEPQIIDYYNEMPYGVNVIDEMNKELDILHMKNNELRITIEKYRREETILTKNDVKELLKVIQEKKREKQYSCCF